MPFRPALPEMLPLWLQVSLNDLHYPASSLSTTLFPQPWLTALLPVPQTPATGGVNLIIMGSVFWSSSVAVCVFGQQGVTTPATVVNSSLVRCMTPPLMLATGSTVTVSVALNGIPSHATPWVTSLYVYDPPRVVDVYPRWGRIQGGTTVTVTGSGFVANWSTCLFNTALAASSIVMSSTTMLCVSPTMPNALDAVVEVTIYYAQYTTSDGHVFHYQTATLASLAPPYGTSAGDTELHIYGTFFVDLSTLACRFRTLNATSTNANSVVSSTMAMSSQLSLSSGRNLGQQEGLSSIVSAYYVSPTELVCFTPNFVPTTDVVVDVTVNGQDWLNNTLTYEFRTDGRMRIQSVFPPFVRSTGAVTINVTGTNFWGDALECVFDEERIPAVVLSRTLLTCVTPNRVAGWIGPLRILAWNRGWVWSSSESVALSYVPEPAVFNVYPILGSYLGNLNITIIGSNFVKRPGLYCVWSTPQWSLPTVTTPVKVTNASVATCLTPPVLPVWGAAPSGKLLAALSLMYNGVQIAPTIIQFMYVSTPDCLATNPRSGPGPGGLNVQIFGANFISSLAILCSFTSPQWSTVYVTPTFYNWTMVSVLTPPLPAGPVSIRCSNDGGLNYGAAAVMTYTDTKMANLLGIVPAHGPSTGGTLAYVQMLGNPTSYVFFRFWHKGAQTPVMLGTVWKQDYVATTCILTITTWPTIAVHGVPMHVQISVDNQTTWSTSWTTYFTYDQPIILTSISPPVVYTNFTALLTIIGQHFIIPGNNNTFVSTAGNKYLSPNGGFSGEIFCRFNRTQVVTAMYLNATAIVCQNPFFGGYVGNLTVDVTFNNEQYISTVIGLVVVPYPQLWAVTPSRFNSDNSTTSMYLYGANFLPSVRLYVQFGSLYPTMTTVPAVWLNTSTLRINVPPALYFLGNMTVAVSIDDGVYYTYATECGQ